MKRAVKYSLILLLIPAVLALAVAWLVGTTSGARYLLNAAAGAGAPIEIGARRVEGRLLDRLVLSGVRYKYQQREALVERLVLDWRLLSVLTGALRVGELQLSGIKVKDDTPVEEKPADLSWPKPPPFAGLLDLHVARLVVEDLSYRRLQQPPFRMAALSTSLSWRNSLLELKDLKVQSEDGVLSGDILAGLKRPSLKLDLHFAPVRPLGEMDSLSAEGSLAPGRGEEQVAGPVRVTGRRGERSVLELEGGVGLTRTSVNLHGVRLARPGEPGSVTFDGSLILARKEPVVNLKVKGRSVDLGPQLGQPTDLTGTVTLLGNLDRYRGSFSLANRGAGWKDAALSGAFEGGRDRLRLAPVQGRLLQGRVAGTVDLAWGAVTKVRAALKGERMNPALLAPQWPGALNFRASGEAAWAKGKAPSWSVQGKLLQSTLRGKGLAGEVDASGSRADVTFKRFFLRGEGVEVEGAGQLSRRVEWKAKVRDLSLLHPRATGEVQGQGWLRYSRSKFAGGATGEVRALSFDALAFKRGQFQAELSDAPDHPLLLNAALTGVSYGQAAADSATLRLNGTLQAHTAELELQAAPSRLRLALQGGYRGKRWSGTLTDFSGQDAVGPWRLEAPAGLVASAKEVTLGTMVLRGAGKEYLSLAGAISTSLRGAVAAYWEDLDLARANVWLKDVRLSGTSKGNLELLLLAGKRVDLNGSVQAAGAVQRDGRTVEIPYAVLNLDADQRGQSAELELRLFQGSLRGRFSSPVAARLALPDEGVFGAQLSDLQLKELSPWLPAGLGLEGKLDGEVTGHLSGERLDLKGYASLGSGLVRWVREDEALYAALQPSQVSLTWQGGLSPDAAKGGRLTVAGRVVGAGSYTKGGRGLTVQQCLLNIDAGQSGTRALFEVIPEGRGRIRGSFSSDTPAAAELPDQGVFSLALEGLDPRLVQPWLPGAVNLAGDLSGEVKGKLLPQRRLEIDGEARFTGGTASWQGDVGEMRAQLSSAVLSFGWREESLAGTLALMLAGPGELRGDFRLPLPARLPVAFTPDGQVSAAFAGQVDEQGVLSAFFPGMVQESRGKLALDLKVGGVWREPQVQGTLHLSGGSAYLPTLGIRVSEVTAGLQLEKDAIRVYTLRARSGPGQLEAVALLELDGWQLRRFRGTLEGSSFETFRLPELQVLSSPQLTFQGDREKLVLRGEVRLPELRVLGPPADNAVEPSSDVIIEGGRNGTAKVAPLAMDVRVRVILGDRVQVKAEGIDAQLGGGMEIFFTSLDRINSSGEINVVKGRYRAYGLDLDIVRGRLYYAGGPINQPTLDIVALREVGEVKAGVTVGGILREPVVKLYSEPAMPDVDILAYMVLGHPLGESSEQGSLMAQAAGVLLSAGQASFIQEEIKSRLGLSILEIRTASPESTGRMGYQEIAVSPAGAPSRTPTIAQSMLTVGKYLTPKLYFSYGRSLFTGLNLFTLRYDIFKHWQIESQTGTESGLDIYYKIEFK